LFFPPSPYHVLRHRLFFCKKSPLFLQRRKSVTCSPFCFQEFFLTLSNLPSLSHGPSRRIYFFPAVLTLPKVFFFGLVFFPFPDGKEVYPLLTRHSRAPSPLPFAETFSPSRPQVRAFRSCPPFVPYRIFFPPGLLRASDCVGFFAPFRALLDSLCRYSALLHGPLTLPLLPMTPKFLDPLSPRTVLDFSASRLRKMRLPFHVYPPPMPGFFPHQKLPPARWPLFRVLTVSPAPLPGDLSLCSPPYPRTRQSFPFFFFAQ